MTDELSENMTDEFSEKTKEEIRAERIESLTRQHELLELRARVLEAKVRIKDAQKKLGLPVKI